MEFRKAEQADLEQIWEIISFAKETRKTKAVPSGRTAIQMKKQYKMIFRKDMVLFLRKRAL